ncbi:MAG TPA: DUF3015 domain-containing protein [Burkholderiales bacterium]|nr:DUF3015 domain-containing protein [Burkholderiales bacterium]HYA47272.1 DUF3015 domain-containing protein [Burkholderiales bacterium]
MRKILIAVVISAVPAFAFAQQNNIGSCGWGAKLFDGQSGIAPQVLAVTTNGTSGNQTFGITTGTSGCTQDGVVKSTWKTAMFIDGNKDRLARDMSIGNGETLDSLAHLIGVREQDRVAFSRAMQTNVSVIFPSGSTTDDSVVALRQVLRSDSELSQYAASI